MARLSRLLHIALTICFLVPAAILAAQDTLNNAGVIELKQSGVGDSVILNKIKASKSDFDISVDGLKKLKEGGLSDEVINAIIAATTPPTLSTETNPPVPPPAVPVPEVKTNAVPVSVDPNDPHEPGIWLYQELAGQRRMLKLKPARFIGQSEGWPAKTRIVFPHTSAVLQLSGSFSFYYYEEAKQADAFAAPVPTADDFTLARLEIKDSKNTRRLAVGKTQFFGGKKTGLDPNQYVPVTVEKIRDGVSRIQAVKALPSGEYCFVREDDPSRNVINGSTAEFYDFGVRK